jgi:hypothetical protein
MLTYADVCRRMPTYADVHTRVGIGARAVGASFEVEPGDTVTLYAAILPSKDSISRRLIKLLLAGQRCAFVC